MRQHVWVVGGSGLLGSALSRRFPAGLLFAGHPVPWTDGAAAVDVLEHDLERFRSRIGPLDPWTIYWAAGAGVIGSDAAVFARESSIVVTFLQALGQRPPVGRGAFFFASSSAVYAGSHRPPFTESTEPDPRSPYGAAKRHQEEAVTRSLTGRLPHVVGRISTLYGPGQDLTKPQGLVSKMCLQAARRQPVSVFVPIDTLRDYIYVDDAAAVIERFVDTARAAGDCATRTRIVADGRTLSIIELAAQVRAISHRRIGMSHAPVAASALHVRDLRLRTEHGTELVGIARTPLAAGVHAVFSDIMRRLARGELA